MTISCPKCHAEMRMYERNGIHIDQCTECRGVFLDRGELEHLISAETTWVSQQAAPVAPAPPPPPPAPAPAYAQGGYPPPPAPYGGYGQPKPYKKRKSFLEELFD